MDIFNKKKLKQTHNELIKSWDKERRYSSIIKLLVEEPDCEVSILLKELLFDKYKKNFWSGLTRENYLASIYATKKDIERKVNYLIEGL